MRRKARGSRRYKYERYMHVPQCRIHIDIQCGIHLGFQTNWVLDVSDYIRRVAFTSTLNVAFTSIFNVAFTWTFGSIESSSYRTTHEVNTSKDDLYQNDLEQIGTFVSVKGG
jgi:hypothetical protein